jgi:hypothetical protein
LTSIALNPNRLNSTLSAARKARTGSTPGCGRRRMMNVVGGWLVSAVSEVSDFVSASLARTRFLNGDVVFLREFGK